LGFGSAAFVVVFLALVFDLVSSAPALVFARVFGAAAV